MNLPSFVAFFDCPIDDVIRRWIPGCRDNLNLNLRPILLTFFAMIDKGTHRGSHPVILVPTNTTWTNQEANAQNLNCNAPKTKTPRPLPGGGGVKLLRLAAGIQSRPAALR